MDETENVCKQTPNQECIHNVQDSSLVNVMSRCNTWPKRKTVNSVNNRDLNISKSQPDVKNYENAKCKIRLDNGNSIIKSNIKSCNELCSQVCNILYCTEEAKNNVNCSSSKSDFTNSSCSLLSMQKSNYYTNYPKDDMSDYDRFSLTTVPDNSSVFSEDSFFTDEIINSLIHDWEINMEGVKTNGEAKSKRMNSPDSVSTVSGSTSSSSRRHDFGYSSSHVANNTNLILLDRPPDLPPKPINEQVKHQKEYEIMMKTVKQKDYLKLKQMQKQLNEKLMKEKMISDDVTTWLNEILPHWESMKNAKKTYKLWWRGLPPCVRGRVWCLTIGNKLNITYDQYQFYVKKSKETCLKMNPKSGIEFGPDECDSGVDLIGLDINRTFPHLCIFQQGGPYYDMLHRLLGAYVCLRPDIGYVQGMSFIAAVLLLNMNEIEAFICFANLLCWPCHKAFFTLDIPKMRCYYATYSDLLRIHIPRIWDHFYISCLTPDLYLVDWIYTVFSKSMNLDLACHIWDLFIRDGDEFIFRAALGILNALKDALLQMDFLHAAQLLTKLPDDLQSDVLLKSISEIRIDVGQYTFQEILAFHLKLET